MTRLDTDRFVINHPIFQDAIDRFHLCFDSFDSAPEPRCTPILGESGCGKSAVVREFIAQISKRADYHPKQIIVIETPSNPTVKTMASEVLQAIGDPLFFKGTEIQMTCRIITFFGRLGTRLLIFDELQNLIDRDSDILCFKASDWLKQLINKAKIPIVIVGLKRTEDLFLFNEQLRRRFTEAYIMEPFDWNDPEKRKMLKGFLKAIQNKISFEEGLKIYSHEMAFRFYCATGGLAGYVMSIVREAKRLACETGELCQINMNHLARAYTNAVCGNRMVMVNPFSGDKLERFEAALKVVEGVKMQKRRDKKTSNSLK